MNYKLKQTSEGACWVRQTWNEETQSIDEQPLAIGESLSFSPQDFIKGSSVFVFQERPSQIMTHDDGTAYTFEEFIAELEESSETREFKPFAYYNKIGDFLEIYWEDASCYVEWLNPVVEIKKRAGAEDDPARDRIIGANIWGIKKILLEAYANCDQPENFIGIEAVNPYQDPDKTEE